MPLRISPTAAAYGLFQVEFAHMTYHLARALVRFWQLKEPNNLVLKKVSRQPKFGRMLDEFKRELQQFDTLSSQSRNLVSRDLDALRRACDEMDALRQWRNARIHAHVQQSDDGMTLYDWETGKPLPITYEECEHNISRAIKVIVDLQAHTGGLIGYRRGMEESVKVLLNAMEEDD